jgi:uncharacterized protein with von Willebrand factor type A (vWA) domain
MKGIRFSAHTPGEKPSPFEQLFEIFKELIVYTSGDVNEAISWLTELDRQYGLTTPDYGIADFVEDLKNMGYLREEQPGAGLSITGKTENLIRRDSLEQIFGKLKKSARGNHHTSLTGQGDEPNGDLREFRFGDSTSHISMQDSLRNAQVHHGIQDFSITENDLVVQDREHLAQTSTVLMIDISHSMILYGEDRITPAKKVAMALSELITTRYPKDTLDVLVFGNEAWQIEIKDLPYLSVGPYHTNTVAGLELAMDLLRRRKNPNRQIFMITDGKPTCIKENGKYYQNSFGLDRKIVNKTLTLAAQCRKLHIPITTFMIARDPYLQEFVEEFTHTNRGKAFYSDLKGLGNFVFKDYQSNKQKRIR